MSECSKLAQKKYKTRHDWESMVIPWELCQKFKFDRTNKWYLPNSESVLEKRRTNSSGILKYKRIN